MGTCSERLPTNDAAGRWGAELACDYLAAHPAVTGLVVVNKSGILVEEYRHGRRPAMRLQSWSMAKSVTSLLLGICLDRELIASLDEPAGRCCPSLEGSLHGQVSLRHLLNMAPGAAVDHIPSNVQVTPSLTHQ